MGFQAFLKFVLICLDDLAWPLFALGYPLRASIHAIETNSNSDTKKLVTYWVIYSLISLFEHAFMGMLQWLPFWPYVKLTIVCWMMIPNFDGAFYVYNHFVHPCLNLDMKAIIDCFNKFQDFVSKQKFLVMAHGPEALDKPNAIESKGTTSSILQNDMKALQVTEKREVGPVNLIPEIEPKAAKTVNDAIAVQEMKGEAGIDRPEIPSDKQQVRKEWACTLCQVTTSSEITLNSHLQGKRHRDTCEELIEPKAAKTVNDAITVQEMKGEAGIDRPEIPSDKQQVQKEWACALCQVTTSSEITLNSHLQGKRHRETCEELMKANNQLSKTYRKQQQSSNGQVSASSVAMNAYLPRSNTLKTSKAMNPKTGTSKYNPQKVISQQNVGKKPQFRCTLCNIYCGRSEDLSCHLWGKKHLARIQELNGLGIGELG